MKDLFRMAIFGIASAIGIAAVTQIAPQQLGVGLWKDALVSGSAFMGYWLDRNLFPYARPHTLARTHMAYGTVQIRRAIVVAATMVATALAL